MKNRVTINDRGAITIPARLRESLGIRANDQFLIERTPQGLLLKPAVAVPIELYDEQRIAEFAEDEEALGGLIRPDEDGD